MAIEAFPLCMHYIKAQMGVRCLYVYRDVRRPFECGFWADEIPACWSLNIPPKYQHLKHIFGSAFPFLSDAEITSRPTAGSNDPYVLIPAMTARKLPHWQDVIAEELNNQSLRRAGAA
jgi:hypothetical protein